DPIQRIGADRFLHVHRHQIAIEHSGGAHEDFAQADGGKFQRESACRPDAALHRVGDGAEMDVAVSQLAPGIADPDDGFVLEDLGSEPLRAQPGAAHETLIVRLVPPLLATELPVRHMHRLYRPDHVSIRVDPCSLTDEPETSYLLLASCFLLLTSPSS